MLNMIRMDLYRMFHTKSMYVIWVIMVSLLFLTTSLEKTDYDIINNENVVQEEQNVQQEQTDELTGDNINLGLNVNLPTNPGEKITVQDVFFANSQGKFYALLMVIFTVIFSTADINSGYIKHIGGQVQKRGKLVISKAVALAFYTIITFIGVLLIQAVVNIIVFKYLEWGDFKTTLSYFLTQLALHYAFVLICMAIAIIIKNNVISMVITICLTMNIMSVVYGLIDNAIRKIGINNFEIYRYTITGKMALLSMKPSGNDVIGALYVVIVFIIVVLSLSSYVFQKRDI